MKAKFYLDAVYIGASKWRGFEGWATKAQAMTALRRLTKDIHPHHWQVRHQGKIIATGKLVVKISRGPR